MSDNISRQATINAMRKEVQMTHDENDEQVYFVDADDAIFVLENMPSVDRKGHWETYNHVDRRGNPIGVKICVCDQCKEQMELSWRAKVPNFCPNCGADMRGDKDV